MCPAQRAAIGSVGLPSEPIGEGGRGLAPAVGMLRVNDSKACEEDTNRREAAMQRLDADHPGGDKENGLAVVCGGLFQRPLMHSAQHERFHPCMILLWRFENMKRGGA
ncbi:unnamed protein product [Gadus morhua 'NCC']